MKVGDRVSVSGEGWGGVEGVVVVVMEVVEEVVWATGEVLRSKVPGECGVLVGFVGGEEEWLEEWQVRVLEP